MNVLRNSTVKIRKPTKCFGCLLTYEVGTSIQKIIVKEDFDNSLTTWTYCPTCQAYWQRYMEYDDEIGDGDLRLEDPERWEALRKELQLPMGLEQGGRA